MANLQNTVKCSHLNTTEKNYIYEETQNHNQHNDQNAFEHYAFSRALSPLNQ
jgi:hypothetical protein